MLRKLSKDGFVRVAGGLRYVFLDDEIKLDKNKKHTIEVVVDRLVAGPAIRAD